MYWLFKFFILVQNPLICFYTYRTLKHETMQPLNQFECDFSASNHLGTIVLKILKLDICNYHDSY